MDGGRFEERVRTRVRPQHEGAHGASQNGNRERQHGHARSAVGAPEVGPDPDYGCDPKEHRTRDDGLVREEQESSGDNGEHRSSAGPRSGFGEQYGGQNHQRKCQRQFTDAVKDHYREAQGARCGHESEAHS